MSKKSFQILILVSYDFAWIFLFTYKRISNAAINIKIHKIHVILITKTKNNKKKCGGNLKNSDGITNDHISHKTTCLYSKIKRCCPWAMSYKCVHIKDYFMNLILSTVRQIVPVILKLLVLKTPEWVKVIYTMSDVMSSYIIKIISR